MRFCAGTSNREAARRKSSKSWAVDSAKIASLKAAISEGRYPIDADRIAEAMIRSELPAPKA